MGLLYFFERIRNPIWNYFMYAVTQFGDETIFLVIALWLFWCVDKKKGYYLLTVGFWGLEINQLLKMIFRVPRPWILDPKFTIVEMARKGAGGYSFPSGHTQIATGLYGSIARTSGKKGRIFGITMIVLVALSRMYLGVHTPWDVSVSLVIGTILVFAIYPVFFAPGGADKKGIGLIFLIMMLFSIGVSIFIVTLDTGLVDAENYADAVKATSTVLGAFSAVVIGYYAEKKYVRFRTEAPAKLQAVKFIAGLVIVLIIKEGLKILLSFTPLPNGICNCIRYGCMVLFVILGWPAVFMKFIVKDGQ